MTEKDILHLRSRFKEYTSTFRSPDPYTDENIVLKIGHTSRVRAHCKAIADSENLPAARKNIAEAVGLFHDIGRFEQFRIYRTFSDKKSENHAELGARVLRREGMLDTLPAHQKHIILDGVQYHNLKDLPAHLDEDTLYYLKIIRDADKLDILNVLTEYYNSADYGNNPALNLDLPDTPKISDVVIQEVLDNRCVNLQNVKTINDFKLLQISWVFDVNFDYTLGYIRTHKYIDKIIGALPVTPGVQKVFDHINRRLSVGRVQ
ncbi:MAG: HD domain-containing protein [bacterium]|nr:HD domain-containing protein [bacterium]